MDAARVRAMDETADGREQHDLPRRATTHAELRPEFLPGPPERPAWPAIAAGCATAARPAGGHRSIRATSSSCPTCPACGEDLSHARADDGPAYLSILVTAKVMGTLMLVVFEAFQPPPWCWPHVFGWRRRHGPLPLAPVQGADRGGAMGQADARVLTDKTALRDAATIIVLRDAGTRPVLMGQRGKGRPSCPRNSSFPAARSMRSTPPSRWPAQRARLRPAPRRRDRTPPESRHRRRHAGAVGGNGPAARRAGPARGDARGAAGLARLPRHRAPARRRRARIRLSRHHAAGPPAPLRRALPAGPGRGPAERPRRFLPRRG
jgi:uncharacterized protein (DUF983 family)